MNDINNQRNMNNDKNNMNKEVEDKGKKNQGHEQDKEHRGLSDTHENGHNHTDKDNKQPHQDRGTNKEQDNS